MTKLGYRRSARLSHARQLLPPVDTLDTQTRQSFELTLVILQLDHGFHKSKNWRMHEAKL